MTTVAVARARWSSKSTTCPTSSRSTWWSSSRSTLASNSSTSDEGLSSSARNVRGFGDSGTWIVSGISSVSTDSTSDLFQNLRTTGREPQRNLGIGSSTAAGRTSWTRSCSRGSTQFNRSFCGKNATLYGKGVYFARDASYSTYPLYSPADGRGLQTVFAVRCVVGQWSKGVKDGLTPGIRDDRMNLLYDTTVDDMKKPSIFVTYHDAQAYPEYRIRFNQANPARSHPQARQPEPGGYRRNWLEGVDGEEEVQAAPANAMDRLAGMLGRRNSDRVAPAPPPVQNAGGGARTFEVRLPPNARPGVTIMARAPNGQNVRLTVPHGVPPGGTITVNY